MKTKKLEVGKRYIFSSTGSNGALCIAEITDIAFDYNSNIGYEIRIVEDLNGKTNMGWRSFRPETIHKCIKIIPLTKIGRVLYGKSKETT